MNSLLLGLVSYNKIESNGSKFLTSSVFLSVSFTYVLFNDVLNSSDYRPVASNHKVICDNELKGRGRTLSWRNLMYYSDNIRMERLRKATKASGRIVDVPSPYSNG
jgi:hypothetical protein